MKQQDRHKHGKVIRISGKTLDKLDAIRGNKTYNQIINSLIIEGDIRSKMQGWLNNLLWWV